MSPNNERAPLEGPESIPDQVDQLIILLHGLGADGQDLFGLVPELEPTLPNTAFLSPNAPFPCDMAPYGFQWFSMQQRDNAALLSGIKSAAPRLESYITQQAERFSLSLNKVALVGFSQGTMMALYVAPRLSDAIACVVGYSGAMLGEDKLKDEITSHPPILLVHGTQDQVVPFPSMRHAKETLRAHDFSVETMACEGIGHGIHPLGLKRGRHFLKNNL